MLYERNTRTSVSLTIKQMEKLLKKMKNSVCNILIDDDPKGTGFFCGIKLDNNKSIKTLITAYHVYEENRSNKKLKFYLNNNEKRRFFINLESKRIIYINKKEDTVIIEIRPKDEIYSNINCLEIENNDFNVKSLESLSKAYKDKFVYIIQYPHGNDCTVSFGMMDIVFNKNEYYIRHKCSTSGGSSGSPIILLNNSKVIGIHLYRPADNNCIKKGI